MHACSEILLDTVSYKHGIKHESEEDQRNARTDNLLLGRSLSPPGIALLRDGKLGTLALRQGDPRLSSLAEHEDVGDTSETGSTYYSVRCEATNLPRSECAVKDILDVDDVKATNVLLAVHNDTSTAHVTTTGDHNDVASIELHEVCDLALLEVELDSVVDFDGGIGVTDRATVMGDDVWYTLRANSGLADLEELVGSLFGSDAVDREATLDVVKKTEVLARLLNGDDI